MNSGAIQVLLGSIFAMVSQHVQQTGQTLNRSQVMVFLTLKMICATTVTVQILTDNWELQEQ